MAALASASVYCVGKLPAIIVSAVNVPTVILPFTMLASKALTSLIVEGDNWIESSKRKLFVSLSLTRPAYVVGPSFPKNPTSVACIPSLFNINSGS